MNSIKLHARTHNVCKNECDVCVIGYVCFLKFIIIKTLILSVEFHCALRVSYNIFLHFFNFYVIIYFKNTYSPEYVHMYK